MDSTGNSNNRRDDTSISRIRKSVNSFFRRMSCTSSQEKPSKSETYAPYVKPIITISSIDDEKASNLNEDENQIESLNDNPLERKISVENKVFVRPDFTNKESDPRKAISYRKDSDKKVHKIMKSEKSNSNNGVLETEILSDEEINERKRTESVLNKLKNSTNQEIQSCGKTIHDISEELKPLNFLHKTTSYKRIDRELFKLMVKLDDIAAENESDVREERRLALTEIHELIKLLDMKMKCRIDDCIICKTGIELNRDKQFQIKHN